MAEQHAVEMGNATIVLGGAKDSFSDGYTTGYLEFYDERHRPSFPLDQSDDSKLSYEGPQRVVYALPVESWMHYWQDRSTLRELPTYL